MKSISITALFAVLSALSAAAPVAEPDSQAAAKTRYLLQTEAVDGKKFDGLFVSTYHTSAGTNAAFLTTRKDAVPAYIQDTSLYFDLGSGSDTQYPMQLDITDPSAAWGTTSINIGNKPSKQFKMSKDGYLVFSGIPKKVYEDVDQGAYWRVCEWTHGIPELFWNFPETFDNINPKFNPATCSLVNLKMVKQT